MAERAECEAVAEELREFAMELERAGHPPAAITDAMLTVGMTSAKRLGGPRHLAEFLGKMAHRYQAEANGAEGAEGATTH
jgi:hypothetical protein